MMRNRYLATGVVLLTSVSLLQFTWADDDVENRAVSFSTRPREETFRKCSRWMSRIPDSTKLSKLSLPGTHDSCALYNGFSFGFARCQSWKLTDQLKAGVRFLDIRCRRTNDGFRIYHGIIDQRMTFEEVRDVCQKFLESHPTECIVMSIMEEGVAKSTTRSFADTFTVATKNDGMLWYRAARVPDLAAVRGRIVVIDRVGTLGGFQWKNMSKQDDYTAPPEQKTRLIRTHLQKALSHNGNNWFINFCSGTAPAKLTNPARYAIQSNRAALEFVTKNCGTKPARLGIVVMDFPGEQLIEKIVDTNFATSPSDDDLSESVRTRTSDR